MNTKQLKRYSCLFLIIKQSEIWVSSTSLSLLPPTNKDKQIDAKILLKSDMVFERLRIDRRSTELSSVQSCSNSKKH